MSILRTIRCNVCDTTYTEKVFNEGFLGWGMIQGRQSPEYGDTFHLCPDHLNSIFDFLKTISKEAI